MRVFKAPRCADKAMRRWRKASLQTKILLTLVAMALLALPLFALAYTGAGESAIAQVQEVFASRAANESAADSAALPLGAPSLEGNTARVESSGRGVREIVAGPMHVLAIRDDGSLWAWGVNTDGQLGIGSTGPVGNYPHRVGDLYTWESVAAGQFFSLAVQSDGSLWAWGRNTDGQLGTGGTASASTPQRVGNLNTWASVSAGSSTSLATRTDGSLWSWGSNSGGLLGTDSVADRAFTPQRVGTSTAWDSISLSGWHALATQTDGTLWSWGMGLNGQLGTGSTETARSPQRVGSLTTWDSVAVGLTGAGSHSLAIQTDGTLWAWGLNADGQLGLGTTADVHYPQRVGSSSTWNSISAGVAHSLATQTDGTLWAWGANSDGQLGSGTTARSTTPQRIGTSATWQSISARGSHSIAARTDGSLWTWGNAAGPLGKSGIRDSDNRIPWRVAPFTAWANRGEGIWSPSVLPLHGATGRIPTNTPIIAINFCRPMCTDATSLGTIDIDNGASVDVSAGTWTNRPGGPPNTRFEAPLTLTTPNTVHRVVASGFLDAQFGQRSASEMYPIGTSTAPNNHPLRGGYPNQPWTFTTGNFEPIVVPPFDIVSVTPTGYEVSAATENVVVTFSEAVDASSGEVQMVLAFQGDVLTVTGAWSANNTVLTIPMPIQPLPYGEFISLIFREFRSAADGTVLPTTWHDFMVELESTQEPSELFTKTLLTPEGTTVPAASFAFEFTRVQVALDNNPPIQSRPVSQVPNIAPNPTVTLDPADATGVGTGTIRVVASLDLQTLLDDLSFPGGGVYVWDVREIPGSSDTVAPSAMNYDSSRFQIRAFVDRYGDLEAIIIHPLNYQSGVWTADETRKLEGMNFTNRYSKNIEDNALVVSKTIPRNEQNNFADLSTLFNFALTLTEHSLAPLPDPLTLTTLGAEIRDASNAAVTRDMTLTGTTLTFQLRDGERLVIPELPAGTTFSVTEAAHQNFAARVELTIGGGIPITLPSTTPVANTALSTGEHRLSDAGENSAAFENNHQFVPPAGLALGNTPYIAAAVAMAMMLALFVAARRRRAIEELDTV